MTRFYCFAYGPKNLMTNHLSITVSSPTFASSSHENGTKICARNSKESSNHFDLLTLGQIIGCFILILYPDSWHCLCVTQVARL